MRLIDANALRESAETCLETTGAFQALIESAPTVDAVPVVRCKECKWWDEDDYSLYGYCRACKHGYHTTNWEIDIYRKQKEDFFCADGERREDEQQT